MKLKTEEVESVSSYEPKTQSSAQKLSSLDKAEAMGAFKNLYQQNRENKSRTYLKPALNENRSKNIGYTPT